MTSNRRPRRWHGAGACDFPAQPNRSWLDQRVYWTPQAHSGVILLAAVPSDLTQEDNRAAALGTSDAIVAHDGVHLRHHSGRLDTQVLILPGGASEGPLAALVPLDADGLDRIAEVERLLRALHGRASPPAVQISAQQRRRLRLMLQAADGRAERATHREIAEVLFGPARVADHPWKTSPMRDRVHRLVRDGRAMIASGYRTLLRRLHRR